MEKASRSVESILSESPTPFLDAIDDAVKEFKEKTSNLNHEPTHLLIDSRCFKKVYDELPHKFPGLRLTGLSWSMYHGLVVSTIPFSESVKDCGCQYFLVLNMDLHIAGIRSHTGR